MAKENEEMEVLDQHQLEVVEEVEEVIEEKTPFLSRKNLYSRINVSVKTMDKIIIGLCILLAVCIIIGIII